MGSTMRSSDTACWGPLLALACPKCKQHMQSSLQAIYIHVAVGLVVNQRGDTRITSDV